MLHNLLKAPTPNPCVQLLRYVISGGVAFAVDFTTLRLLNTCAGWHYQPAAACGFVLGLLITYLLSILWVFDERRFSNRTAELSIFTVIGVVGLGLNALFMWVFVDMLNGDVSMAKIITTAVVAGWNFTAKKCILFSKRKKT
ncbi:MAG: GtrA family protein [Prevotellaceae bacterium]|nr:GtrA family protein [Prevotellaceae bacterium]